MVRPRHRRGWESQLDGRPGGLPAGRVRPRHRRGWESQRHRHPRCPSHPHRASSSPTGMGVSTLCPRFARLKVRLCVLVTDGDGSLNTDADNMLYAELQCVLVTDGDGSLNIPWQSHAVRLHSEVRPRHRRGWESQHAAQAWRPGRPLRASSSPTGMGVSTP